MAKNKSPLRKNLLYILAALVFVLSLVLLYTQYNSLRNLKEKEEAEELALEEARIEFARHMQHMENAALYEERLAYAQQMIPEAPGEDRLLVYLHRLASEYKLHLSEVHFEGREETEHYVIMPISITAQGGYQELRQFLKHLFNGERAIRVNEVRISRLEDGPYSTQVYLSAVAFYSPPD